MGVITNRPWGHYETYHHEHNFFMRKLTISPGEELSLGSHEHRDELWVIILGTAHVKLVWSDMESAYDAKPYEFISIPKGTKHMLQNNTKHPVVVAELAYGSNASDEDIIRHKDKYGRTAEEIRCKNTHCKYYKKLKGLP